MWPSFDGSGFKHRGGAAQRIVFDAEQADRAADSNELAMTEAKGASVLSLEPVVRLGAASAAFCAAVACSGAAGKDAPRSMVQGDCATR